MGLTIRQYVNADRKKISTAFQVDVGIDSTGGERCFWHAVLFRAPDGCPLSRLILRNIPQTARRDAQLIHETRERLETLSSAITDE